LVVEEEQRCYELYVLVKSNRGRNPKHEIRNPKQIQNTKEGMFKTKSAVSVLDFSFRILELFRISCFGFAYRRKPFSRPDKKPGA
jgi:hypothetical protein